MREITGIVDLPHQKIATVVQCHTPPYWGAGPAGIQRIRVLTSPPVMIREVSDATHSMPACGRLRLGLPDSAHRLELCM